MINFRSFKMDKQAEQFLDVLPWKLVETGFHATQSEVSESLFALGNEYSGIRGYFDEGYSGNRLQGSYFNGLYDYSQEPPLSTYRGVVTKQHFMVNAADWLATTIIADGEQLDLNHVKFTDFRRELDFKSGLLIRSFVWQLTNGKRLQIKFERLLDMLKVTQGYQRITLKSLGEAINVQLDLRIDFNTKYGNGRYNYWQEDLQKSSINSSYIIGETVTTKQLLASGFKAFISSNAVEQHEISAVKEAGQRFNFVLPANQEVIVERDAINLVEKNPKLVSDLQERLANQLKQLDASQFEAALVRQRAYWQSMWDKVDIQIEGDAKNQQGIRFCIFQLLQTYHGQSADDNIGAKGLTGEAYNGHTFWDTEACCLPFYLFNNIKAAKNLLSYRFKMLPQARNRARELDCVGACYPIATLNGDEASNLWQHASTQFQPSTAVAYGIWHYVHITDDQEFLKHQGLEMLLEISRFLYSRGDYGQQSGKFGFYGVMGPDEFQVMVNHNMYTNIMAQKTLEYTLTAYQEMSANDPEFTEELARKIDLQAHELADWQQAVDKMMILQTKDGLFEQNQGFFDLPHVDISKIPNSDFPLYDHWSYDHLFRNDMIKQADVLMLLFLLNSSYSKHVKEINYDYYEPRTIHESSLSPAIHSILAAELHKYSAATRFFEFATRMDLDNYNRNTNQGLHTTSLASAWLNIVYGFGGLRSDAKELVLQPTLPKQWQSYQFHIQYQEATLTVKVLPDSVILNTNNSAVSLRLYGDLVTITSTPQQFNIPKEFRQ